MGYTLGASPSPVIAVVLGDRIEALRFWNRLLQHGVYVNLMLPPATPNGVSLIRCSVSAAHTSEQIDAVCAAFADLRVGRRESSPRSSARVPESLRSPGRPDEAFRRLQPRLSRAKRPGAGRAGAREPVRGTGSHHAAAASYHARERRRGGRVNGNRRHGDADARRHRPHADRRRAAVDRRHRHDAEKRARARGEPAGRLHGGPCRDRSAPRLHPVAPGARAGNIICGNPSGRSPTASRPKRRAAPNRISTARPSSRSASRRPSIPSSRCSCRGRRLLSR